MQRLPQQGNVSIVGLFRTPRLRNVFRKLRLAHKTRIPTGKVVDRQVNAAKRFLDTIWK